MGIHQLPVEGVACRQCPVLEMDQETLGLLDIFARAKAAKTPLYGPDLSLWPIWAVDASEVLARCEREHEVISTNLINIAQASANKDND